MRSEGEREEGRSGSVQMKWKQLNSCMYLSECNRTLWPLVVKSNQSWGQVPGQLHHKVHPNKVQKLEDGNKNGYSSLLLSSEVK